MPIRPPRVDKGTLTHPTCCAILRASSAGGWMIGEQSYVVGESCTFLALGRILWIWIALQEVLPFSALSGRF